MGAKIRQRHSTRKIFAVFQTDPDGLDDAFAPPGMISGKDGCNAVVDVKAGSKTMSALPPKANIDQSDCDVRFVSIADKICRAFST